MRIFTFLLAMLTLQTFAYNSSLVLDLEHGHHDDGYRVNLGAKVLYADDMARANYLYAGRHILKVYKKERYGGFSNGHRYVKIYDGHIDIPDEAKVEASLKHNGTVSVDRIVSNSIIEEDDDHCDHPNHDDFDNGSWNPIPGGNSNSLGLNDVTLASFVNRLEQQSYDRKRSQLIERELAFKSVRVDQLLEILETFKWDSYKLDVVELMYPRITNKNELYRLEDVFKYNSYKKKIREMKDSSGPGLNLMN